MQLRGQHGLCTGKFTYRGGCIAANPIRREAGMEGEFEGEISFQWTLDYSELMFPSGRV